MNQREKTARELCSTVLRLWHLEAFGGSKMSSMDFPNTMG